jgi:hemerythrin-like metal-binding protein
MSGKAAQEINELLDTSNKRVQEIVSENQNRVEKMIHTSTELLGQGASVTAECKDALQKIIESSARVRQMVDEIAVGSQDSARGITEITKTMHEISRASTLTGKAAETCRAASSELGEEVERLRTVASELSYIVQGKAWINPFQWKDSYSLAVGPMDQEHKVLVEKINALAHSLENQNYTEIAKTFGALAAFTVEHFSHEEAFMKEIAYPDLDIHKRIHKSLLEKVTGFGKQVETRQVNADELMIFLNDWLLKHILGVDMKYARFSRGEESPSAVSLSFKSAA